MLRGIAQPDVDSAMREANEYLNRYQLHDAEDLFIKLVYQLKSKSHNSGKTLIQAYSGLAEVYIKTAHRQKGDLWESIWGYIQAIVLFNLAIDETEKYEIIDDTGWFVKEREWLRLRAKPLEDYVIKSLSKLTSDSDTSRAFLQILNGQMASMNDPMENSKGVPEFENMWTNFKKKVKESQENIRLAHKAKKKLVTSPQALRFHRFEELTESHRHSADCLSLHEDSNFECGCSNLLPKNKPERLSFDETWLESSSSTNPRRPSKLELYSEINMRSMLPLSEQVTRVTQYLKNKAERVKLLNGIRVQDVSVRSLIEQNKTALSETLEEFDNISEYLFSPDYTGTTHSVLNEEDIKNQNVLMNEFHSDTVFSKTETVITNAVSVNGNDITDWPCDKCRYTGSKHNAIDNSVTIISGDVENDNIRFQKLCEICDKNELNNNKNGGVKIQRPNSFLTSKSKSQITKSVKGRRNLTLIKPADLLNNDFDEDSVGILKIQKNVIKQTRTQEVKHFSKLMDYDIERIPIKELQSPHENRVYRLETFNELSPLTETTSLHFDGMKDFFSPLESPHEISMAAYSLCPITENRMNLALAHCIRKVADNFFIGKDFEKAGTHYEQALSMFYHTYQEGMLDEYIAYIIKNCGIIKTIKGDIIGGVSLLDQAKRMLVKFHDTEIHVQIAEIMYEIGNAYLKNGQIKNDIVLDHLISQIKNEIYAELLDPMPLDSDGDGDSDHEGCYREQTYPLHAYEAISCLKSALFVLNKLKKNGNVHSDLLASVVSRLGDCYIIVGNFDKAISYYEEALKFFPFSYKRNALPDHAHVMCMLGAIRFLLHNYSKATTFFECSYLMYQRVPRQALNRYHATLPLAFLSLTYYASQQYFSARASASRAAEIFNELFSNNISKLSEDAFWLINQTIYTLGVSYLSRKMTDQAIEQFEIAFANCETAKHSDMVQKVIILKGLGDCHSAEERHQKGLDFYNEAIWQNEVNKTQGLNSSLLHNMLLGKTAGAQCTMQQYNQLSDTHDEAKNIQSYMQSDIQGDLVTLLHQLGQTHTYAGDIDKAIECFSDCLEAYKESNDTLGPEMAGTLSHLATLYHVKACMTEDLDENSHLQGLAEVSYQESLELEFNGAVAVKYANFLYHQDYYMDAILLLRKIQEHDLSDCDVIFSGVEQAILPEHLENTSTEEEDDIVVPALLFAKYLVILCNKSLNDLSSAVDALISLMNDAYKTRTTTHFMFLGYSLLELGIYSEAAIAFMRSHELTTASYNPSLDMSCFCVVMDLYCTLQKGIVNSLRWHIISNDLQY